MLDQGFVKKAVHSLWIKDAIPFPMVDPGLCDAIAEAHIRMSYSLLSRNLTTFNVITHCEAHRYQGTLVLTSCDKRPAGEVTGFGEVSLLDRRRLSKKKEIGYPFITMREKEIFSRPWINKRIRKIGEKRKDLTPLAKGFLDSLLSTEEGVRLRV